MSLFIPRPLESNYETKPTGLLPLLGKTTGAFQLIRYAGANEVVVVCESLLYGLPRASSTGHCGI